jgi:phage terminase large subunit-like protein
MTIQVECPGDRAIRFIEKLTLSDAYRGEKFKLHPWQKNIVKRLYGTLKGDGRRQYKRLFLLIPRKNGKTALAAALAVYALLGSGKQGEQILVAAASRDQANSLFKKVVEMIRAAPSLDKRCKIRLGVKQIKVEATGNELIVLSSDGRQGHSYNPSLVILDELHTQKNTELYDSLTSGFGARPEPLTVLISTAGNDRESLVWKQYDHAKKVLSGEKSDPTLLPVIFEAEPTDDWTSPEVWAKANPGLGTFNSLEEMEEECTKAQNMAFYENTFKQVHLNLWVSSGSKWMSMDKWYASNLPLLSLEELEGCRCWGGLDLSNKSDITAFSFLFELPDETYQILPTFWIPEDYAAERDRRGETTYLPWAEDGYINLTAGERMDFKAVEQRIEELCDRFQPEAIRYDPWGAEMLAGHLFDKGYPVQEMAQTFKMVNESTHYLDWLIGEGRIRHGSNPVMDWMVGNATVAHAKWDKQVIRLDKTNSHDKIDGVATMVMTVAAATLGPPPPPEPGMVVVDLNPARARD